LEHDDAGDGGADFGLVRAHALLFLDFRDEIGGARVRVAADVAGGFVAEEGHQDRKANNDGELQKHLAAVAEKDPPAA